MLLAEARNIVRFFIDQVRHMTTARVQTDHSIPAHLPARLSISCWIWSWITSATPDEPYGDLERCFVELRERGFNAVRVEAGLNWAFLPDGTARGPMDFGPFVPGYGWNASTVNSVGGGRHDVLSRLFKLFELADHYDVWVILTSWEYQDSSWFVADPAIRKEVYSVPADRRYMHLARLLAHLIDLLKERGLSHRIAFAEILNESDCSEVTGGEEGRRLHTEAISFLRGRHSDILISADFSDPGRENNYALFPDNAQVFDYHIYAGAPWYFSDLFGLTIWSSEFDPRHPEKLEVLRRVLRKDIVPWDTFMKPAQNIREFWRKVMWLYENLDNDRWDEWVGERFGLWESRVRQHAEELFAGDAREARRRGLPLVMDEGGFFYPPRLSRFELSPRALAVLDLMADLAIKYGYWGFMPGTYCGPEHQIWHENPEWLRQINGKFLRAS